MAETILGQLGQGHFRVFSGGSHPTGRVNPLAVEQLALRGYPTHDLASKSWDRYLMPTSPVMDYVITVCEQAAHEAQPCFPGNPSRFMWRFQSPSSVQGTDAVVRKAFSDVCNTIEETIKLFVWQNTMPSPHTTPASCAAEPAGAGRNRVSDTL